MMVVVADSCIRFKFGRILLVGSTVGVVPSSLGKPGLGNGQVCPDGR